MFARREQAQRIAVCGPSGPTLAEEECAIGPDDDDDGGGNQGRERGLWRGNGACASAMATAGQGQDTAPGIICVHDDARRAGGSMHGSQCSRQLTQSFEVHARGGEGGWGGGRGGGGEGPPVSDSAADAREAGTEAVVAAATTTEVEVEVEMDAYRGPVAEYWSQLAGTKHTHTHRERERAREREREREGGGEGGREGGRESLKSTLCRGVV